jgi:Tfp pilus assembly protein PilN
MEQQVNLYQPILGAERRLFSARTIGIALALIAVCLCGIAGFADWRTRRIEATVARVEQQDATSLALAARADTALKPHATLAELDATARQLSENLAARERVLAIVRNGASSASSGFAARLEAIGRHQQEGIWLTSLVLDSGDWPLALKGATTDPRLVPAWLASLAGEQALEHSRFDHLLIQRVSGAAPAAANFELGATALAPPAEEKAH